MKKSDLYHKWIEWSEEDQTYIGKCSDLITGIHGDDPVKLYRELCEVVEDVILHLESENRLIPKPRVHHNARGCLKLGIHLSFPRAASLPLS
jgi:predicted RNase H-like HicB family nuclease